MSATPPERVRLRLSVRGKVRFLSHRDVARVLERAIRRAGIPVAYSQGFSPRPKLHFGLALSTGYESDAEFVDIDLDPGREGVREPVGIAAALGLCLPMGLRVDAAAGVEPGEASLQDAVTSTEWVADVVGDPLEAGERAASLLASRSHVIEIVRKGKQVSEDLRPLLVGLAVQPSPLGAPSRDVTRLDFELGTKPRSVRPAELFDTLGLGEPLLVRRTHQWIHSDGRRLEPLGLDAASPHAEVRA